MTVLNVEACVKLVGNGSSSGYRFNFTWDGDPLKIYVYLDDGKNIIEVNSSEYQIINGFQEFDSNIVIIQGGEIVFKNITIPTNTKIIIKRIEDLNQTLQLKVGQWLSPEAVEYGLDHSIKIDQQQQCVIDDLRSDVNVIQADYDIVLRAKLEAVTASQNAKLSESSALHSASTATTKADEAKVNADLSKTYLDQSTVIKTDISNLKLQIDNTASTINTQAGQVNTQSGQINTALNTVTNLANQVATDAGNAHTDAMSAHTASMHSADNADKSQQIYDKLKNMNAPDPSLGKINQVWTVTGTNPNTAGWADSSSGSSNDEANLLQSTGVIEGCEISGTLGSSSPFKMNAGKIIVVEDRKGLPTTDPQIININAVPAINLPVLDGISYVYLDALNNVTLSTTRIINSRGNANIEIGAIFVQAGVLKEILPYYKRVDALASQIVEGITREEHKLQGSQFSAVPNSPNTMQVTGGEFHGLTANGNTVNNFYRKVIAGKSPFMFTYIKANGELTGGTRNDFTTTGGTVESPINSRKTITSGNWAYTLFYMVSSGNIYAIAPRESYATLSAVKDRRDYLLQQYPNIPKFLIEYGALFGILLHKDGTLFTDTTTNKPVFYSMSGELATGGFNTPVLTLLSKLPAPVLPADEGKALVATASNSTTFEYRALPDLTGIPDGSEVTVLNGKLVAKQGGASDTIDKEIALYTRALLTKTDVFTTEETIFDTDAETGVVVKASMNNDAGDPNNGSTLNLSLGNWVDRVVFLTSSMFPNGFNEKRTTKQEIINVIKSLPDKTLAILVRRIGNQNTGDIYNPPSNFLNGFSLSNHTSNPLKLKFDNTTGNTQVAIAVDLFYNGDTSKLLKPFTFIATTNHDGRSDYSNIGVNGDLTFYDGQVKIPNVSLIAQSFYNRSETYLIYGNTNETTVNYNQVLKFDWNINSTVSYQGVNSNPMGNPIDSSLFNATYKLPLSDLYRISDGNIRSLSLVMQIGAGINWEFSITGELTELRKHLRYDLKPLSQWATSSTPYWHNTTSGTGHVDFSKEIFLILWFKEPITPYAEGWTLDTSKHNTGKLPELSLETATGVTPAVKIHCIPTAHSINCVTYRVERIITQQEFENYIVVLRIESTDATKLQVQNKDNVFIRVTNTDKFVM